MADFFDALAARALGIAPVLAPVLPARFAEPGPGFGEVTILADAESTGERASQPAAAAARVQNPPARNPKPPAQNPQSPAPRGRSVPAAAGPGEDRPPPPGERPSAAAPRAAAPAGPHPGPLGALEAKPAAGPAGWWEPAASVVDRPEPPRPEPVRPAAQDPEPLQAGSRPERAPSAWTPRLRETVARAQPPGTAHEFPAEEPSGARVTISIGHVEVRAINRTEAPAEGRRAVRAEPPRQPQPRLSLDDYLRGGRRR